MKIIVFGGAGFIGTHLIARLVENKDFQVVSVDIAETTKRLDDVEYLFGDVRDLSSLEIEGEIVRIYNFAAVHTTPGHETFEYYETNVLGAVEVTKFAEKNNVKEVIFTSSISVYGPSEERKYEHSKLSPVSAYGYSKMLAENIHKAWLDRNLGSRLVTVRPAVVFGPGEGGNFTRLAKLLRKGFFVYPGRKDTIKSCIYVEDLLLSIEHALNKSERFVLFNGAYARRYTLEDIVQTFIEEQFKGVRTFLFPKQVMISVASILKVINFMDVGIHPERILKLINSTDVYPQWLENEGLTFENGLSKALQKWADDSQGTFS